MGDFSKAEVVKLLPSEPQSASYPLLLALNGSNGNAGVDHWASAAAHGWLVCLPRSSQDYDPDANTTNHWDCAQQEVLERYTALAQDYSVDPDRVVLAGFSQGAGLAAWLVLSGQIRAAGLVLVAPFSCDINKIHALIDAHRPKGLKVFLVVGHRDRHCLEVARQLVDLLPRHGVMCQLIEYLNLEHRFPVDFEKKLPEALDFVSQTW